MTKEAKGRRFTVEDLQRRFQSNPSLLAENTGFRLPGAPGHAAPERPATPPETPAGGQDTPKGRKRGKKRREMNATEREFHSFLARRVADGGFMRVDYEGITLRWGEGAGILSYTPDFGAMRMMSGAGESRHPWLQVVFFEVKGAYAWQKDIVKFKAARAQFPYFEFQLWEKGEAGWQHTI